MTISLRPESIAIARAGAAPAAGPNRLRVVVEQVVYHGLNTQFHLRRTSGEPLIVVRQNDARDELFDTGTTVDVSWEASRNHVVLDAAA